MAERPRGERLTVDVIGHAVHVPWIATGEIVKETRLPSGGVRSGLAAAKARAGKMMKEARSAAAHQASSARWG